METKTTSLTSEKKASVKINRRVKPAMVTLNDYFKTSLGVYSIVKHSIENQNNLMLIGPTGLI